MEPLRTSVRSKFIDTSYRPSHRRALSEGTGYSDPDLVGDKALLEEVEEPYDGRAFPMRGVSPDPFNSHVDVGEQPTETFPSRGEKSLRPDESQTTQPRDYLKIIAWVRYMLVVLALVGSALVLGANANMLAKYRANVGAKTKIMTSTGAVMGWWPAWPPALDLTPTWAFIMTGSVSTAVFLGLAIASYTKVFRYLENTFLSSVSAVTCLLLAGGWVAVAVVSYFHRQNVEADLAEWACWHSNDNQFSIPGFSFSVMCAESNISKFGSLGLAGVNVLIFATIIAGCFCIRSKRFGMSYGKLTSG